MIIKIELLPLIFGYNFFPYIQNDFYRLNLDISSSIIHKYQNDFLLL